MKSKKRIVIVIVLIVLIAILAIGGVFLWNYIGDLKEQNANGSGLKVASNVDLDEDDDDEEKKTDRVSSINVNLYKTLNMIKKDDGTAILQLGLHNGNKKQYLVTITVNNKEIYRSDLIPAGASLDEVTLSDVELEKGTYEAVAIFTIVSEEDNQTALGSTGVSIPLVVK